MTSVFQRAMPTNLLTIKEWSRFAREAFKIQSWENAAKRYAEIKGGAHVLLPNDTLVIFTQREDGKISRQSQKYGTWKWS
jgi:hypothetical protein